MGNVIMSRVPVYSLVEPGKGDISNRVNCAGAQLVNNLKTAAEEVVIIGGTIAGARAAVKSNTFVKVMNNIFNSTKKVLLGKNSSKASAIIVELLNKLKNLPAANKKALFMTLVLGELGLSFVGMKRSFKSGQIDQKYTDKAKLKQAANQAI